ncbi:FAD-linked oxidase C-terminal domain-containing protein, partial [Candidatus Hakubella thermalkaliphila]
MAPMVRSIREIALRYKIDIAIFGHAGDGNLHPTCMTDERDEEEMRQVERAFGEIFHRAVELGGTISGEHGVGVKKRPFLALAVRNEGINTMWRIKQALDPNDVLNPGKIFPP